VRSYSFDPPMFDPARLVRGFAAVGEPNVAVCLLPGTEIAFEQEVECRRGLGFSMTGKVRAKTARFRQVNSAKPAVHHDALEFPDGQTVLLTRLCDGQRATVRQLPAALRVGSEAEEQKSVELSLTWSMLRGGTRYRKVTSPSGELQAAILGAWWTFS
jgi:hypothetical protein